ncbi:Uncharacterized protein TCAP_03289 [Tolypocladium capitatum]|uniref:Uncharacterized protein n=1 Tax=Tolypocladium capitatum TaxID=45235 RepID=A0A2K3QGV2_9HYPO|nr:Uncharacterized protein TCAP_03289 [Tolypocladium capitatum]
MAPQDAGLSPKPLTEIFRYHRQVFKSPAFWTSRHLEMVGCRFEDFENANDETEHSGVGHISIQPSNYDGPPISEDRVIENVGRLAKCSAYLSKAFSLSNLLLVGEGHAFDKRRKGPCFFWAGRSAHRAPYSMFLRHLQPGELRGRVPQLIGYIHYGNISGFGGQRHRELQRQQYPGRPRFRERLSEITPSEWSEDPYLVCILLSIAQRQERGSRSRQPTTYSSRLLVTNESDSQFIYLFEAEISSELLRILDKPNISAKQTVWPIIKRKRIPFEPYENFQKRITAQLLAPSPLRHSEALLHKNDAGIPKQEIGERECGRDDDESGAVRQMV